MIRDIVDMRQPIRHKEALVDVLFIPVNTGLTVDFGHALVLNNVLLTAAKLGWAVDVWLFSRGCGVNPESNIIK